MEVSMTTQHRCEGTSPPLSFCMLLCTMRFPSLCKEGVGTNRLSTKHSFQSNDHTLTNWESQVESICWSFTQFHYEGPPIYLSIHPGIVLCVPSLPLNLVSCSRSLTLTLNGRQEHCDVTHRCCMVLTVILCASDVRRTSVSRVCTCALSINTWT